jgi:hypothetical protein
MRKRAWRLLLGGALLIGMSGAVSAQPQYDPDQMKRSYEEKLKKEFMKKIEWERELEDALAKSKEKNLPVMAYFTRSYAP